MKPDDKTPPSDHQTVGSEPYSDPFSEPYEDRLFITREGHGDFELNWRRPEAWVLAAAFVLALLPRPLQPEFVRELAPYVRTLMFLVPVYLLIRKIRGDRSQTIDSRSLDSYSPPQPQPDHDESRWSSDSMKPNPTRKFWARRVNSIF